MTHREQVLFIGDWLMAELTAIGCPPHLAADICFAAGQRQAMIMEGDLWQPAVNALADYRRGVWDIPGPWLASHLLGEAWGDPQDPVKALQWLTARIIREREEQAD